MSSRNHVIKMLCLGRRMLERAGISAPQPEAEMLMVRITGYKRHQLYLEDELSLPAGWRRMFLDGIAARCGGMPIQYITGVESFMGLDFCVDKSTLIPRQDTEVLVEHVLLCAKSMQAEIRILDIGTGSGNIAVSLAVRIPDAKVTAIDISQAALDVAAMNAQHNGVSDRVEFLLGDMFSPLKKTSTGRVYDILVSNPPYIASAEIGALEAQVKDYEPRTALDGGDDGLDFYRKLVGEAAAFVRPGGLWAVEVGYNQAQSVRAMLEQSGRYGSVEILKDIAKIDRVVSAVIDF